MKARAFLSAVGLALALAGAAAVVAAPAPAGTSATGNRAGGNRWT